MRINHNIAAQVANANLKRADNRMSASLQRLSSGYKINKAAENPAGLTISNKMRTQIRTLDQASRNADDGVSLIRTAEGALSEIENMLQRCRELSVQAANDTLVVGDREAIQKEVDQLMAEVDRIAETTDFNGKKLLSGECGRVITCKQLGVQPLGVSDVVEAGEYSFTVKSAGEKAQGTLSLQLQKAGEININGTSILVTADMTEAQVYEKVLSVCDMMDIDVKHDASLDTTGTLGGCSFELISRANGSDQQITFRGTEDEKDTVVRGKDAEIELDSGSNFTGKEGIVANGGTVTVYDRTGFEMSFSLEDEATGDFTFTVYDTGALKLQIGTNESEDLSVNLMKVSCQTLKLREADGDSFVNLCSHHAASNAITLFDNAIESISAYRSKLGAYENRLDSTISSLDISSESTTASMSRIMDTDMAESMTEYTQESVLSQAATSILAQANNRPQQVMSLLQS